MINLPEKFYTENLENNILHNVFEISIYLT